MTKQKLDIDVLKQIQKVEAPPFLFTRIEQKIANQESIFLSKPFVWSISLSFVIIMCFNTLAVIKNVKNEDNKNNIVTAMNLMPENSLYK